jgi:hypothetical protein
MKKKTYVVLLLLISLTSLTSVAYAQDNNELTLKMRKDFGFNSGTGVIQGTFSLSVKGGEELVRVVYTIDGELMGESSDPPSFRFRFKTDDYPVGTHIFQAIGYSADGEQVYSNQLTRKFISSSESSSITAKLIGTIIGLIVLVFAVSFLISMLVGGKYRKGSNQSYSAPENYGPLGGTICPKCGMPFSRHIWGLNLGLGKFDRCPYCGKWSITYRASNAELRDAEQAAMNASKTEQPSPQISEEERLQKELEDSRYDDL